MFSPKRFFGGVSQWDGDAEDPMEDSWLDWMLHPRHKPLSHEFINNLKAGVTVSLVNVPLSISLALAAGATPTQGVITAFWCGLMAALFSSSHFNVVGPTGALSGMLSVISGRYGPDFLPYVALSTGVVLALFTLLRVDRYMRFVCTAVAHGFSVGVALIIAVAQLPSAFGLAHLPVRDNVVEKFEIVVQNLGQSKLHDSVFFFANLVTLFYLAHRWGKVPWAIIFAAVGIAIGMAAPPGYIVLLNTKYPDLKLSLTSPLVYDPKMLSVFTDSPMVIIRIIGVAIVSLLESLISAHIANKMTTDKQHLNYSTHRESIGLTIANVVGGLFGGIPCTAALARTSLNIKAGAFSRLSGIISSIMLALLASVLLPYFEYVPMSTISALLILVAYHLVDFKELKELRLSDTPGMYVFIITAGMCVMSDTFVGLIAGVTLSLLFNLAHIGVVRMELHEAASHGGAFVAVLQSSMVFVNATETKEAFVDIARRHRGGQQLDVVLDDCAHVDFDGAQAFGDAVALLQDKGWAVRLTGAKHLADQMSQASHVLAKLLQADEA